MQLNRVERKQNTKGKSGGLALYIRQSFYQYCSVGEKQSDDIIRIKTEGQLFDLALICIYAYAILFRQIQAARRWLK